MSSYKPTEQDVERLALLIAEEEYQKEIKEIDRALYNEIFVIYGEEVRAEIFKEGLASLSLNVLLSIPLWVDKTKDLDTFTWTTTKEGYSFWEEVYTKMEAAIRSKIEALCEC